MPKKQSEKSSKRHYSRISLKVDQILCRKENFWFKWYAKMVLLSQELLKS